MKEKNIHDKMEEFHIPRWEELPSIDLYVDQVVGIIESSLHDFIGDEKDPIITKSMINNYVKHGTLKAPVNKKYDREHLTALFVLSLFKKIYSINDITVIIKKFVKDTEPKTAYNAFCNYLENALNEVFNDSVIINAKTFKEDDLLKHAVLSFANYLYVKRKYLKTS